MIEAYLLFNPISGRAKSERITASSLIEKFRNKGIKIDHIETETADGVPDIVNNPPADCLLVVAGGDGTIYHVVQKPECLHLKLALIPLGTANNLANTVGIPSDIEQAIDIIANGVLKRIDLAKAGDRVFTQAAGAGFHASAFHIYGDHQRKSILDGTRAFFSALKAWEPQPIEVIVDGETFTQEAMQITVANTRVYGWRIPIAPDARVDDGLLDIVIIGSLSKLELIENAIKSMEGKGINSSNVKRVRGKRIVINPLSDIPIPVHADAEPIGYAPVTIEVLPACLRLIVPK